VPDLVAQHAAVIHAAPAGAPEAVANEVLALEA